MLQKNATTKQPFIELNTEAHGLWLF